jgi:hypothetical protein
LRLDADIAEEIVIIEARRALMGFVESSNSKSKTIEAVKELMDMVAFSNDVIRPLINLCKPKRKPMVLETSQKNKNISTTDVSEFGEHIQRHQLLKCFYFSDWFLKP